MIPAGIINCVIFADEQDAQSKPWGKSVYSTGMLVTVLGVFNWFFWLIYFIGGKGDGGGGGCGGGVNDFFWASFARARWRSPVEKSV